MSTEAKSPWRWLALLAAPLLLIALAVLFLPLKRVGDLRVEDARVVAAPAAPAPGETARRIAVTFSAPQDLAQLREETGLGFIVARLSACEGDGAVEEVIAQRAEYRPDRGRVQALGASGDRHRYRVTFDDRLASSTASQVRTTPAAGNASLCFALDGASMGLGKLWSNTVRLPTLR